MFWLKFLLHCSYLVHLLVFKLQYKDVLFADIGNNYDCNTPYAVLDVVEVRTYASLY